MNAVLRLLERNQAGGSWIHGDSAQRENTKGAFRHNPGGVGDTVLNNGYVQGASSLVEFDLDRRDGGYYGSQCPSDGRVVLLVGVLQHKQIRGNVLA